MRDYPRLYENRTKSQIGADNRLWFRWQDRRWYVSTRLARHGSTRGRTLSPCAGAACQLPLCGGRQCHPAAPCPFV